MRTIQTYYEVSYCNSYAKKGTQEINANERSAHVAMQILQGGGSTDEAMWVATKQKFYLQRSSGRRAEGFDRPCLRVAGHNTRKGGMGWRKYQSAECRIAAQIDVTRALARNLHRWAYLRGKAKKSARNKCKALAYTADIPIDSCFAIAREIWGP